MAPEISSWNSNLADFLKSFVFDAGLYVVALTVAAALLPMSRRSRWAMALLTLALALHTSPLPGSLLGQIFFRNSEQLAASSRASGCLNSYDTLVVLGGGVASPTLPTPTSQVRLETGAVWLRQQEQAGRKPLVVLTGGPAISANNKDAASVLRDFLQLLLGHSLPQERQILADRSENTYQDAAYTRAALNERSHPLRVVVVTSPSHLPRAVATFVKQGFEVCALPAENIEATAPDWLSFRNATRTRLFLNEVLGFVGYRLRGWI